MYEAKLITGSIKVNPYESPSQDLEEGVDRRDERFQAAKLLAEEFWKVHSKKTNPETLKRDYFNAHISDFSALAVATDEQKEEAYKHFEEEIFPLLTFDYRNE